jgi:hypothetical protein
VPVADPQRKTDECLRLSAGSLSQQFDLYLLARHTESGEVVILETAAWVFFMAARVHHTDDKSTLAQITEEGGKRVAHSNLPPVLSGEKAIAMAHQRFKILSTK